jgi:hypothetical protein
MKDKPGLNRRSFLKQAAGAVGAAVQTKHLAAQSRALELRADAEQSKSHEDLAYPRQFRGRQLRMISFPLGGVAAGSIGLEDSCDAPVHLPLQLQAQPRRAQQHRTHVCLEQ